MEAKIFMELNAVDGAFCPSVNGGFLRENSASPHSSSSSLNASSSDRRRLTFTMRWCRGVCLETESIVPSRSSFWSEKDKRFPFFFFFFEFFLCFQHSALSTQLFGFSVLFFLFSIFFIGHRGRIFVRRFRKGRPALFHLFFSFNLI